MDNWFKCVVFGQIIETKGRGMYVAVYQPLGGNRYEPYLMGTDYYKGTLKIQRYVKIPDSIKDRMLKFEMRERTEENVPQIKTKSLVGHIC